MEEYNAWIFLQDKWPLLLLVVGVILAIIIINPIARKEKRKKPAQDPGQTKD